MFSELSLLAAGDTGDFTIPLPPVVDAGGPYTILVVEAVQMVATIQINSGLDIQYNWSADRLGEFSNEHILNPTFLPYESGDYVLTLTVTTSNTLPIIDSADMFFTYSPHAVDFSSGTKLLSNGALNTSLDSTKFTGSMWIYYDQFTVIVGDIFHYGVTEFSLNTGVVRVVAAEQTGDRRLIIDMADGNSSAINRWHITNPAAITVKQWFHLIFSINGASLSVKINGEPGIIEQVATGGGSTLSFSQFLSMSIDQTSGTSNSKNYSDIWLMPGVAMNLNDPNVLSKFIEGTGSGAKPVYLGPNGQAPTGQLPKLFMTGEAVVWRAGTNSGTGEDFTPVTGIGDATTEPVEVP